MRLSGHLLGERCTVLDRVEGARDRLGQGPASWQARPDTLPCAVFPASERTLRRAGLLGVKVSKEVYLGKIDLSPLAHRLLIGGTAYAVTDVQEFGDFTVVAVSV